MTTSKTEWTVSNIENALLIGEIELECGEYFYILSTKEKLIFGGFCNAGFLESGYFLKEEFESLGDALEELKEELNTYYQDGGQYTNRIVYNDRM